MLRDIAAYAITPTWRYLATLGRVIAAPLSFAEQSIAIGDRSSFLRAVKFFVASAGVSGVGLYLTDAMGWPLTIAASEVVWIVVFALVGAFLWIGLKLTGAREATLSSVYHVFCYTHGATLAAVMALWIVSAAAVHLSVAAGLGALAPFSCDGLDPGLCCLLEKEPSLQAMTGQRFTEGAGAAPWLFGVGYWGGIAMGVWALAVFGVALRRLLGVALWRSALAALVAVALYLALFSAGFLAWMAFWYWTPIVECQAPGS